MAAPALRENRVYTTEYRHQVWGAVLPEGCKYEEVFNPDFWAHVAAKMKTGDLVDVRNDEGTLFAQLYVRNANRLQALMGEIRKVVFADVVKAVDEADGYEISYRGAVRKWSVIRKGPDGGPLKEELASRDEANAWLREHLKAFTAKA